MGQRKLFEYVFNLLLLLMGIALGFIGYTTFNSVGPMQGIVIVVVDAVLVSTIIIGMRVKFANETTNHLKELTTNVKKISNGEQNLTFSSDCSDELHNLYASIETLRDDLKHQNRVQESVLRIVNTLATNIELTKLLDELLPKILEISKSNWGAFYLYNSNENKLDIRSSVGFSKTVYKEFDMALGEGYIGKAAESGKVVVINDIPDDTIFTVRTFLGKVKPSTIMTVPIFSQSEFIALIVLASIPKYTEEIIETVKVIREYLGVAIVNCTAFEQTKRLTSELRFQNQLIQNMNDELEEKVLERTDFLDSIIDSIKDYAIVAMDNDGNITKWSEGATLLLGLKQSEVMSQNIVNIYGESVRNIVAKHLKAAQTEGRSAWRGHITRKDGTIFYADTIISSMFNYLGEPVGFTSITREAFE